MTPTEMAAASQRIHFQMDCLRSSFDVTGKTVRPPPAGTIAFPRSCPLDPSVGTNSVAGVEPDSGAPLRGSSCPRCCYRLGRNVLASARSTATRPSRSPPGWPPATGLRTRPGCPGSPWPIQDENYGCVLRVGDRRGGNTWKGWCPACVMVPPRPVLAYLTAGGGTSPGPCGAKIHDLEGESLIITAHGRWQVRAVLPA